MKGTTGVLEVGASTRFVVREAPSEEGDRSLILDLQELVGVRRAEC